MAKKNRVTEPEQSTFDRAKAAFDRVGEDYVPASKAVVTEEPAEAPEVPVDDPAAPPETDGTESASAADAPEPVTETDNEPVTETDAADASEPVDSNADMGEPADSDADALETDSDAPETDDDSGTPEEPEPEAVEDAPEEPEDEPDGFDAEEPEAAEVTEMEKLTMETKEITLGVHHSAPPPGTEKEPREQEKKSKPRFKAFEQLKDAFRASAESADDTPVSGSSRDAAIRKRVMQIEDEETRNYLLDRVLPQMAWYGKKVTQYRTMYFRLMAATILLGALIPVFSVGANSTAVKVIIAFLGASVTGINAYIALHNYRDLWLTYQTTRETLVHTLYCYFNQAGLFSYNNMSAEDLNVLLVNVCEDTLSKEHGGWTTILQKT